MSEPTDKKPDRNDRRHEAADEKRTGDKSNPDNRQGKMGERLDEGLEETFPSSDPVSVKITK